LINWFLPEVQKRPLIELTIVTVEGVIDRLAKGTEASLSEFKRLWGSPERAQDKSRQALWDCVDRASHIWFGLASIIDDGHRGGKISSSEDLSIPIGLAALEGRLSG
jgi:hypothetical protein